MKAASLPSAFLIGRKALINAKTKIRPSWMKSGLLIDQVRSRDLNAALRLGIWDLTEPALPLA